MLHIGSFRAKSCHGTERRSFLKASAALPFAGLAVAGMPGQNAFAATTEAAAKSVIFVWLWGAPSHLDTFDPKPEAPNEYRGPFSTIATQSGVRFSELVPKLAARSDKFSLVRSNISHDGGHPGAGNFGMTGYAENPEPVHPSFGSIVSRHFGEGKLPSYLMLGRGVPRDVVRPVKGAGGGRWGRSYDPFIMNCDELGQVNIPALKLIDGLSPERLQDRTTLTSQFDQLRRDLADSEIEQFSYTQQQALTMLTSENSVTALDLSRENVKTREAYGQTSFGQSLLLARRLVESGVPYVHVNWSEYVEALTPNTDFGWDTHIHNFDLLPNRHCPIFDRAFAALLDDLHDRHLIDSTLVVCMGEFGRTPKINNRAARDHWPQCFFSIWAGGGIKPGRVIGKSDKKGENPATRPIEPTAVGTTILDLMGINSVARAELDVLRDGEVIHELL